MKSDQPYLRHIQDAIEKIESYAFVGRDIFMTVSHWQDAIIRQLEIIGEVTKRLSSDLRSRHKEVPWRRIAGLRDVLIHELFWCGFGGGVGDYAKGSAQIERQH